MTFLRKQLTFETCLLQWQWIIWKEEGWQPKTDILICLYGGWNTELVLLIELPEIKKHCNFIYRKFHLIRCHKWLKALSYKEIHERCIFKKVCWKNSLPDPFSAQTGLEMNLCLYLIQEELLPGEMADGIWKVTPIQIAWNRARLTHDSVIVKRNNRVNRNKCCDCKIWASTT